MRVFPGAGVPQSLMTNFPGVLGWSSGCFAALASDSPVLFLYEPPLGADRDATFVQRLEFVKTLAWSAVRSRRRSRAAFWRMVTQRRDGTTGFERAPAALREALVGSEEPLALVDSTGRSLATPPASTRVHVALGSQSTDFMQRCVDRLGARVPLASVTVLKGLDHLAPLVAPARIAEWISSK